MPEEVVVSDISLDVLDRLKARYPGIRTIHNDNQAAGLMEVIFAAVHPPAMASLPG